MTAGWAPAVGCLCSPSSGCLHFLLHHERCWQDTLFFPPEWPCLSGMKPPEGMRQTLLFLCNSYTVVTVSGLLLLLFGHLQQTLGLIAAVSCRLVHQQSFLDQEESLGHLVLLDST